MNRLSTFNKIFLLFCVVVIIFVILKVPHEKMRNGQDTEYARQANPDKDR